MRYKIQTASHAINISKSANKAIMNNALIAIAIGFYIDSYGTYLSIIEQPTNRIRYRYRSEKGSHGGLNGENSSQMKKTYPTIKVSFVMHLHRPNTKPIHLNV